MIDSYRVCDELAVHGKFLSAAPLQSVTTAATVRVRNDRPMITVGPFAETTEQLGGFFLLELNDLDEAIAVASRLPSIDRGAAEIRPVFALDGLPPERPIPASSGSKLVPYLLLCYDDEAAWREAGPQAQREAMAEAAGNTWKLNETGRYLNASPLHPSATATCVRLRNGKRVITDGPFAETNEVLGGFYLVLAESREEALEFAKKHPGARSGAVEVRPLFDTTGIRD
jgi:hypothetical protein